MNYRLLSSKYVTTVQLADFITKLFHSIFLLSLQRNQMRHEKTSKTLGTVTVIFEMTVVWFYDQSLEDENLINAGCNYSVMPLL